MSEEQNSTPSQDSAPPAPAEAGDSLTGSIGLSEGYRGINIVNLAPVNAVPEPGGLPPVGGNDGPSPVSVSPVEPAPSLPSPSQE